jgi:hypothetical protein
MAIQEKKGTEISGNLIHSIGKFDMAKNFLIGGLSGMMGTSCVSINKMNANRFNQWT